MPNSFCEGKMQLNKIIKYNLAFYFAFTIIGLISIGGAYFFGKEFADKVKFLFYSYYVFPALILSLTVVKLEEWNIPKRVIVGIIQGIAFLILGYLLMLLFVKVRIELGLGI